MLKNLIIVLSVSAAAASCKSTSSSESDVLSANASGLKFQYLCHYNGDMIPTADIGISEIDNGQIYFYAFQSGKKPSADRYPFELKGTGGLASGTRIRTYNLTAAAAATMILQTPPATGNPEVGAGQLKVDVSLFSNGPAGKISFTASGNQGIEGDTSVVYQCVKQ